MKVVCQKFGKVCICSVSHSRLGVEIGERGGGGVRNRGHQL
jgi:hypothetical protein